MHQSMSQILKTFSRNLRRVREAKNLSQEGLAALAGLDRTYVSGCERGVRNPSLKSIEKLALALSVRPGELIDEHKP